MPEGPEVKTVCLTLKKNLVGNTLLDIWHSGKRLRNEINLKALKEISGTLIKDVQAYGKVIFIESKKGPILYVQLGMTGQLRVDARDTKILPHTHIRWPLSKEKRELRFVDPRRFGMFSACTIEEKMALLKKLGPDAFFLKNYDKDLLIRNITKSKRAIKDVLLDQQVIAGVGNIYASECLFLAGINPKRKAFEINKKECLKLIDSIVIVMNQAYENCGTTFSNFVDGDGKKGNNIKFLKTFKRENKPCFYCHKPIVRIVQNGRSSFFCDYCQS